MQPIRFVGLVVLFCALLMGSAPGLRLGRTAIHDPESHHLNGRYVVNMGRNFGRIFISPLHWKGKDFLWLGGTIAATGLSMAFLDHSTREWVEDHQNTKLMDASQFMTHLGEAPFLLGLSAALYAGGEIFKADGPRRTGLLAIESYCITGIIVTGVKYLFARARPLSGEGPSSIHWFSFKNSQHAFPSGHAAAAFAVAAVFSGGSDNFLVGATSYGIASIVALSRVHNNEHWFSDVVAGSAIGYFIGKKVISLNRPGKENKASLSIGPAPGGLSLSLSF